MGTSLQSSEHPPSNSKMRCFSSILVAWIIAASVSEVQSAPVVEERFLLESRNKIFSIFGLPGPDTNNDNALTMAEIQAFLEGQLPDGETISKEAPTLTLLQQLFDEFKQKSNRPKNYKT